VTGPNRTDLRGQEYVPDVTGDPNPSQTCLNGPNWRDICVPVTGFRTHAGRPAGRVVLRVTSIVTGATSERFEIVKWFYIEADHDTGYDAAGRRHRPGR
jgi:hypothetical protein